MELLAALDEVGIPVHEEFIWLYFVDNLPPRYEFINNNLQGSKKPLTRTVLEDVLRSRYTVQSGGKKGRTVGRGRGRGGPIKASWTAGAEARGFHRRRK